MGNFLNFISERKQKVRANFESRRARIYDEESVVVCTLENRSNCYDPFSLEKAFHPLGIVAKCFGLFPCYDFDFVKKLSPGQIRFIHFLEYCYATLIFLLQTAGAIICIVDQPQALQMPVADGDKESRFEDGEGLDYIVKVALIYSSIFFGVLSLFVFPMNRCEVQQFVQRITNIDKILRFDGRMEERWFAKKVIIYLTGCFLFTSTSFLFMFVYDVPSPRYTDFLMGPIMTLALMALIIPTGLAIFFLNVIRLRMEHFNRKLNSLVDPFLLSCETAVTLQSELNAKEFDALKEGKKPKSQSSDMAEDLEKMRVLHSEIHSLLCFMSCIFGMHLVRDFLYSLIGLILYTYFLLYFATENGNQIWVVYAGQAIFILMKILMMVCFAQMINCQNNALIRILQRVSLRRLGKVSITQVQAFLAAAYGSGWSISAAGYFHINKALLTSIVGSITTYFIILMQFRVQNGGGFVG